MINDKIDKIIKVMLESDNIILSGHTNPDGDAIGSMTALCIALEKAGKKPKIILEKASKRYNVIPYKKYIVKSSSISTNIDLLIVLDCGAKNIFNKGLDKLFKIAKKTINIDHHLSNEHYGDYNHVVTSSSSTSEIIFEVVEKMGKLNKDIAKSIYAGIIYDTGGFRHNSTSSKTHSIVSKLKTFDIDTTDIYYSILHMKSLLEIQLLQVVISRIKVENKICYSYIKREDLEKVGASKKDLGGMIDFLTTLENTKISLFVYEKNNGEFKFSFRSKEINVNKSAKYFGGGGHKLASGCTINGKLEDLLKIVLEQLTVSINE